VKPISHRYRADQDGDWKLWVLPSYWSPGLWTVVQNRVREQVDSKHPQVLKLSLPEPPTDQPLFLKVFHSGSVTSTVKDLFRSSKSVRALRQSTALAERGFNAPLAIAAGEQRRYRWLRRSFLLTLGVSGEPLPLYLERRLNLKNPALSLAQKRSAVRALAREIKRLHRLGFVHGDLIPWNILVATAPAGGTCFYFVDNDRTTKYPPWVPQRRWRRNLVQLNRFPLAGITLQDRLRFLHQYLSKRHWDAHDRRFIGWLEKKTRQRRRACDQIHEPKSFRELMRWDRGAGGTPLCSPKL
jgi:hypothetical protein